MSLISSRVFLKTKLLIGIAVGIILGISSVLLRIVLLPTNINHYDLPGSFLAFLFLVFFSCLLAAIFLIFIKSKDKKWVIKNTLVFFGGFLIESVLDLLAGLMLLAHFVY